VALWRAPFGLPGLPTVKRPARVLPVSWPLFRMGISHSLHFFNKQPLKGYTVSHRLIALDVSAMALSF
jgi:hypothetical protein